MTARAAVPRTIVTHAPEEALGPRTGTILGRLGYRLVPAEDYPQLREVEPGLRAELLLVDERRLGEVAGGEDADPSAALPIVLLTGKQGAIDADRRVVGAVKRPAGLHDLYRLMQQVFEDTPRTTPRIATQLRARCEQGERRWDGRVLSLSENGCLIRSPESIPLGQRLRLGLTLPNAGDVSVEAEAAYQLLPDTGLVFNAVEPAQREALERFVTQTILVG